MDDFGEAIELMENAIEEFRDEITFYESLGDASTQICNCEKKIKSMRDAIKFLQGGWLHVK